MIAKPWPWWVAGPLIGLMVPLLLVMGNRSFGISSTLRHFCAAVVPARIPFFQYRWRDEAWNLVFAAGIFLGGFIAAHFLADSVPVIIDPRLAADLARHGVYDHTKLMPPGLFSFGALATLRGFLLIVVGGFLVGFGTRYAGGCTSGHSIMGLSTLQWPSLVATICFMAGGFLVANFVMPLILSL